MRRLCEKCGAVCHLVEGILFPGTRAQNEREIAENQAHIRDTMIKQGCFLPSEDDGNMAIGTAAGRTIH